MTKTTNSGTKERTRTMVRTTDDKTSTFSIPTSSKTPPPPKSKTGK